MSTNFTRKKNNIAAYLGLKYSDFIDEISADRAEEKYIWTVPLVSRSIFHDETYSNLCEIETSGNPYHKGCQNNGLAALLIDKTKLYINFFLYYKFKNSIRKKTNSQSMHIPNEAIIVFTPSLSTCFDENGYVDRYFTGIKKYTDRPLYFVPDLIMNGSLDVDEFITNLQSDSNYSFLFAESLLEGDFWKEILKYIRLCKKMAKEKYIFDGMDISDIISDSLNKGIYNHAAIEGVIYSLFLKKLSQINPNIKNFIVWYEGRPSDVMTVAAINRYFPKAHCVACEQFPPDENFLSLHFTKYQTEIFNPNIKISVPSKYYIKDYKKYSEDTRMCVVPILRNQYELAPKKGKKDTKSKKVLLLLSGFEFANQEIIERVNMYFSHKGDINIVIKNHPIFEGKDVSFFYKDDLNFAPQYVSGRIKDCLSDIDVVVTSSTTSSVEVLFGRTPLIIIVPDGTLQYAGIPEEFSDLYSYTYGQSDFEKTMTEYLYGNAEFDYEKLNLLFEAPTKENMAPLFE